MKPILFDSDATTFTNYGLGVLGDVVSCKVTEERNGAYELEMEYPVDGIHYEDIQHSRIIYAKPFDGGNNQPFRIYKISKPINGIVTVNAEHISYQLAHIPCNPFVASSVQAALVGLKNNAIEDCPFTFWTDKSTEASYSQDVPASIRSRLGGTQGSVLDLYGGEYEWDGYTVKLYNNRGSNNGVVLRYGKNITDIRQEENIANTITGVVPYYLGENDILVTLQEDAVYSPNASNFPYNRTVVVDFSGEFSDVPTEEQLRTKANAYINASGVGVPDVNIKVSFVALWQTEEYKDVAVLERVKLCDTITVVFEKLGVEATAKVVKTVYDSVLERYESIEIGQSQTNMSTEVSELRMQVAEKTTSTQLEQAISAATDLITGGLGGHVVFKRNAAGEPEEILVMDTDDIETAVNVIRINQNGIGFSNTGYNGPFRTAWTIDGSFVADFITSGKLSANIIEGGVLNLGGYNNENGQIYIYDSSGTQVGIINNAGISIYSAVNQKQIIISPIVGFINRDSSGGVFQGLVYEGYSYLPAYNDQTYGNKIKEVWSHGRYDTDTFRSDVIGSESRQVGQITFTYSWRKYYYTHSAAGWNQIRIFSSGTEAVLDPNTNTYVLHALSTSVTHTLPQDFRGKQFEVSIDYYIDWSKVRDILQRDTYSDNIPKCKAYEGRTWSETSADASWPGINTSSQAYQQAQAYQGVDSPYANRSTLPLPSPATQDSVISLSEEDYDVKVEYTYTKNETSGTVTITGSATYQNRYNINEALRFRLIVLA